MAKHKKDGACRRLIVTGCLAERYRHELVAQIPEIDAVLGTGEVGEIVRAIAGVHGHPDAVPLTFYTGAGAPPLARTHADVLAAASLDRGSAWPQALQSVRGTQNPAPSTRPRYIYDADTPRVLSTPPHYAFLKIAEGCNYKCAFCIIPTLRGAYRSRPSGSIVPRGARPGGARREGTAVDFAGTRPSMASTGRSAGHSPTCSVSSTPSRGSSGFGCCTFTPRRSTTERLMRWPGATRSASTSTFRCSTPRTRS